MVSVRRLGIQNMESSVNSHLGRGHTKRIHRPLSHKQIRLGESITLGKVANGPLPSALGFLASGCSASNASNSVFCSKVIRQ